jgi:polysaccharide export outer membrane protein
MFYCSTSYLVLARRALILLSGTLLLSACASRNALDGSQTVDAALPSVPVMITADLVASQKHRRQRDGVQDLAPLTAPATPYTIGAGDILAIMVWGHPELAAATLNAQSPLISAAEQAAAVAAPQGFVVSEQGTIQFPFAGNLPVAGLTELQARDLLAKQLAPVINKPNVTLRVQAFRSQRIYVDGEVKAPGVQVINDIPMTLTEAINRAGGVTPAGDQSQLSIVRAGQRYRIDLPALVQHGEDPNRIMLRNGDVLRVRALDESKVFVSGEVVTPKALLMHSGRLSLNEAIGEAGGINPVTGDARRVFVVRRAEAATEVYQLDARDTGALALAESFELAPRDLVFIDASGLANWQRTLSMLIPGSLPSAVSAGKQ